MADKKYFAEMSQNSDDNENSHLARNESDIMSKVKAENFHLRLRCHNLENELGDCTCSRANADSETLKKEFYEQRSELNRVMKSHQDLVWNNERLSAENYLLKDRCERFRDVENKLSEYECLKMKYDQLNAIVQGGGSITDAVGKIMRDNDFLIQTNAESQQKVQTLQSKLCDRNKSLIEDERKRRKSLTHSLTKMFKDANESSFQNTSRGMSLTCMQCDEYKVYIDKLNETMIKMTVDFQGLNKVVENKTKEIAELEKKISAIESQPKITEEQIRKYKVYLKQTLRKYDEEKLSKKAMSQEFDELISFYIKQQGEQHKQIQDLLRKEKSDVSAKVIKKTEQLSELFVKKLSEVNDANEQITSQLRNISLSQDNINEYNQVGQYSPQYRIHAGSADISSIDCDTDSVYCGKNVSLNATAFNLSLERSFSREGNIKELMDNMQQKVRELGEVVQDYLNIVKNETIISKKDMGTSVLSLISQEIQNSESIDHIDNDDYGFNANEDALLKMVYEEEKLKHKIQLDEQIKMIQELTDSVAILQRKNREIDDSCKSCIESLNSDYNARMTDFKSEIIESRETILNLEEEIAKKDRTMFELNCEREESEAQMAKQIEELKDRTAKMKSEMDDLLRTNFNMSESLLSVNQNFEVKIDEMEQVFQKVKAIIEAEPQLFPSDTIASNAHSINVQYIWDMLCAVERCLQDVRHVPLESSINSQSWKATHEMSSFDSATERPELEERDQSPDRSGQAGLGQRARHSRNVSLQSGSHLLDLTNVTDINDEPIPDLPVVYNEDLPDKYKYILDNPEKVHKQMKYFYETCMKLKGIVLQRHEETKQMKKKFETTMCKAVDDMTRQIDQFKTQLDLCKKCLVKSQTTLPDSVVQELLKLNLL